MSRNTKIALIVIGALVIICLGICGIGVLVLPGVFGRAVSTTPADAHKVGASIADYTLPPGYAEQMGMDLMFEKIVMIGRSDRRGMDFMLLQVSTPTTSRAQMEQQMRQTFAQQFNQNAGSMQYIKDETVTIRGQQVPLSIYQSKTSLQTMQQAIGTFTGKNGLVMVMIMGTQDQWDEELMQTFLGSIQ